LKLKLEQKSLLTPFTCKFDLILFNTPYLPCEKGENYSDLTFKDKAIYGGKQGYEVIEEFIYQIGDKLKENGTVLMIFSSFSNLEYIQNILNLNLFKYEILKEENIQFEKLYCLKITKSEMLKTLEKQELTNIKYLTKGKHSKVMQAKYKNKKVVIKIGLEKDIQIETLFLTKLKKENFTPEIISHKKEFVVMEMLEGETIKQFLENKKSTKQDIETVLNKCLEITQRLDELKINKQELTNPHKHIFINKKNKTINVKFIDFERSLYTNKPKNTTQFLSYIRKQIPLLKDKEINIDLEKLTQIAKQHKTNKTQNTPEKTKLIQINNLTK